MSLYLGFDTSNYTTSVALYDPEQDRVWHAKRLLPVKPGEKGIRQSDAVFHHTQQLPELLLAPQLHPGNAVIIPGVDQAVGGENHALHPADCLFLCGGGTEFWSPQKP